jgi:hypothetical protein
MKLDAIDRQYAKAGVTPKKSEAPSPAYIPPAALFRSIHQLLMFTYTFTPNQHAVTAAVERTISMFAKERYGDDHQDSEHQADIADLGLRVKESRGLTGVWGAGQAGMVKSAIDRLPLKCQAVIRARFNVLDEWDQIECKRHLSMVISPLVDAPEEQAQYLVQGYYGHRAEVHKRHAEFFKWSQATYERRWQQTRGFISGLEQQAFNELEPRFQAGGLIE